ncbi:MAG: hypothetical protein LBB45_07120 [Methanobrevibacter sp.]|nr:hypothetical protein [Candidatus Methanovirga basalitermitum]
MKIQNLRIREEKHYEYDEVCQTIKTDIPLKIKYSENNKFRVTYKHPYNNKYDLVIVIFIKEINNIKLITAFPENKRRKI